MDVISIRNKDDIAQCVDMYFPHEKWLGADRPRYLATLTNAYRRGEFFKIAVDGKGRAGGPVNA